MLIDVAFKVNLFGATAYVLKPWYLGLGSKEASLPLPGTTPKIPLKIMFDRPARWNTSPRGPTLPKAQEHALSADSCPLALLHYLLEATQP